MTPKEKAIDLWNKFLLYAETEIPPEAANNVRQSAADMGAQVKEEINNL